MSEPKLLYVSPGRWAKVDPEDFAALSTHRWKMTAFTSGKNYAYARIGGRRRFIHRIILPSPRNLVVDHKDGDTLNCQRDNLRICTKSQNMGNCKPHKDRAGKFKGVHFRDGKYIAQICLKRIRKHLGRFDTAHEAAEAYDRAARERFGNFARTNQPQSLTENA